MHQLQAALCAGTLSVIFISAGCGGGGNANIRLVNAVPSQPSLDMLIDSNNVASGVGYGTASGYSSVGSGSRHLQVEVSGTTTVINDQTVSLGGGSNNTVLDTASGATVLTDNNSAPPSGDVNIRAINASATLGTADIYIVPSNADISGINPTASNVAFESATSYQSDTAGSYTIIFTFPGQKVPVISTSPLSFSSGQVRSVVGLDGQNGGFTTAVLSDAN